MPVVETLRKFLRMRETLTDKERVTRNPTVICLPVADKNAAKVMQKTLKKEMVGKIYKTEYVQEQADGDPISEDLPDEP